MAIITLPRSAIKELNEEYVRIELPEKILLTSYSDLEIVKNTYGILKKRKREWLRYIEESRSEWDRT